jgi:hypothetical protein
MPPQPTLQIEIESLLRDTGLTRRQIQDRDIRIDVQKQIAFLNLVSEAMSDPVIGFHHKLYNFLSLHGIFCLAENHHVKILLRP